MSYHIEIIKRDLPFRHPVSVFNNRYSRETLFDLRLTSFEYPGHVALGECAPIRRVSYSLITHYGMILKEACRDLSSTGKIDRDTLRDDPSILFGLETALQHLHSESYHLWDTPFTQGRQPLGLSAHIGIDRERNVEYLIRQQYKEGFTCIDMDVNETGFNGQLNVLKEIRKGISEDHLTIRINAGGSFSREDALDKIFRLSEYGIQSVRQPLTTDNNETYAWLCSESPLPIAIDMQLNGVNDLLGKRKLLDEINPQYLVLHPSHHGGVAGCEEWIEEARRQHIGYWIASDLESIIGLNAIAQWTATLGNLLPQSLDAISLYKENSGALLSIRNGALWFNGRTDSPLLS